LTSIRHFDKKPFLRIAKASKNRSMQNVANTLRNRGYNARIIQNVHSQSLYVRPRRYYAPIPETDPMRMATFPIALVRATSEGYSENPNMILTNPKVADKVARMLTGVGGMTDLGDIDGLSQDVLDLYSNNQALIDGQTDEVYDYIQRLKNDAREIALLEYQSQRIKEDLTNQQFSKGGTNLTEDQWNVIQSHPKLANLLSGPKGAALTQWLTISGLLAKLEGDVTGVSMDWKDYDLKEMNGMISLVSNSGQVLGEYDKREFAEYFASITPLANEAFKRDFVLFLRKEGKSEHSFLASLLTDDLQASKKELEYWNWDGWDAESIQDVFDEGRSGFKTEKVDDTVVKYEDEGFKIVIDPANLVDLLGKLGIKAELQRGYSRSKFVQSTRQFSSNNSARGKIAEYMFDRKMKGHNVVRTDDVQAHLSRNMKKPPVMAQTSKFLSQDGRFDDVGYNKKVKLWSIKDGGIR